MIQEQHGKMEQTHDQVTASSTVEGDSYGFNSLIIWHKMSGTTSGGFVAIENRFEKGETGLDHPAPTGNSEFGANVKSADEAASYMTIIRGVSRRYAIILSVTDGTHDVYIQPINL